jgi:hypothetical protein
MLQANMLMCFWYFPLLADRDIPHEYPAGKYSSAEHFRLEIVA